MAARHPQYGEVRQVILSRYGEGQVGDKASSSPTMGNNLRKLRHLRDLTHEQAAQLMGVSRGQFIKLERGERRLTSDYITRAAAVFRVSEADVFSERKTVPLVGYVGAGALAHIFSEGQGPFDEVEAPDGSTDSTVAVEIRGDSLGTLFEHWLVFYDDLRDPPGRDMIGKLCVVGLQDGRILIKKLVKGQLAGRFNLLSNTEPPMYDIVIEWAATVKNMVPR